MVNIVLMIEKKTRGARKPFDIWTHDETSVLDVRTGIEEEKKK